MRIIKTPRGPVHIASTKNELGRAGAEQVVQALSEAIFRDGRATIGLSGGHTPPLLYEQLTSPAFNRALDWSKVHFFVSDERCVPHESNESNWGMAERLLFSKLKVGSANLHPTKGQDGDPVKCAVAYEEEIRKFFAIGGSETPSFDVIQLGMGPDGHTASLFPGTKALKEETRLVVNNVVDAKESNRITFTLPMLNAARHIVFLIEGEEKSHVLSQVLTTSVIEYPSQRVDPSNGDVVWVTDEAAARDLLAKQTAK
jgi:6-phosphogluconolactonase